LDAFFYHTALAKGGTSDGDQGPRPNHDATYYAAFVRNPDGNKIERCLRRSLTETSDQERR